jgi:hypothetical protein
MVLYVWRDHLRGPDRRAGEERERMPLRGREGTGEGGAVRARDEETEKEMTAREIVRRLIALGNEVEPHTPNWYMVNRFIREAMEVADKEEAQPVVNARVNTRRGK